MALHGLGKINARLAELRDDDVQHVRTATAMFSAALGARPDNHLAANELGVLLCRTGRPGDAARLFERAIDSAPSATAYHNLAVAQRKLGMHGQSSANEQESQRLAAWERAAGAVSQRVGVRWVAPADMARVAQPSPLTPKAVVAEAPNKSRWKKTLDAAKSLQLPQFDRADSSPPQSAPAARSAAVCCSAPALANRNYGELDATHTTRLETMVRCRACGRSACWRVARLVPQARANEISMGPQMLIRPRH